MVSAGDRQPNEAPSSSSLPTRASTGSAARWWPGEGRRGGWVGVWGGGVGETNEQQGEKSHAIR